jgi:arsenate reductase (thioredoxin)
MTTEPSKPRVLFLCTGNSCRSQMAEAFLRHEAGDRFEACSAGMEPKPINPLTLQVLKEVGISTEGLRSKAATEFLGRASIHHAIIVCDKAQNACPHLYPFALQSLYWPFEDPAAFQGTPEETLAKFRGLRDQIHDQIKRWLAVMALPGSST